MPNRTYWQVVWFIYFFAAMMIHHGWSKGHLIVGCACICAFIASRFVVEEDEETVKETVKEAPNEPQQPS